MLFWVKVRKSHFSTFQYEERLKTIKMPKKISSLKRSKFLISEKLPTSIFYAQSTKSKKLKRLLEQIMLGRKIS
jgi:hypothetical protein